jgi:hypothetical protein
VTDLRERVTRAIMDKMVVQMRPAPGPENHAWWTDGGVIDTGMLADAAISLCRDHYARVAEGFIEPGFDDDREAAMENAMAKQIASAIREDKT